MLSAGRLIFREIGVNLSLYHNCDSTTIRLRHDYIRRKIDVLIFCSLRIASNGSRRARYVVVGSQSYRSRIAIMIQATIRLRSDRVQSMRRHGSLLAQTCYQSSASFTFCASTTCRDVSTVSACAFTSRLLQRHSCRSFCLDTAGTSARGLALDSTYDAQHQAT